MFPAKAEWIFKKLHTAAVYDNSQGQGKASIENVTQKVALISPPSARRLICPGEVEAPAACSGQRAAAAEDLRASPPSTVISSAVAE
ncbi:hypothetical protein EYF80_023871 [Liparis tanakae]|uniref:Uncharacterized protein n=1 Tax=Liparis tanakae TaxID=230148 RepID=A0A4Z2HJU6_9TELE|nr:hypothetical protein EYF80_023871 [Liparis tanakae]